MMRTLCGRLQSVTRQCASTLSQNTGSDNLLQTSMLRPLAASVLRSQELCRRMTSNAKKSNLAGKVAVVTGSTDGIGLAVAKRLCEDGASVMISSRKQHNVDAALSQLRQENLKVAGTVCHVAKEEDRNKLFEETVKEFGGIDILVSCAGLNPYPGTTLSTPEDTWDKIFEINLKAPFLLCKEIVPYMKQRGGGSIVLVGTYVAYIPYIPDGVPGLGAYCISKTALVSMMKTITPELAPLNIRVNCFNPGIIKTKFSGAYWQDYADTTLKLIPMKRFATPDECSGVVSFMVSDDASYMTGESIVVAGGMVSRL